VALLGQTASRLRKLLEQHDTSNKVIRIQDCRSMAEAVSWCFSQSRAGDAVLLSPACASFGMFHNFVERAEVFCRAVQELRTSLRRAG